MQNKLSISSLPGALFRYIAIHVLLGCGFLLLVITTAIYFHDAKNLLGLVLPAYFYMIAIRSVVQFNTGEIVPLPAVCLSIQGNSLQRKNYKVIFQVKDEQNLGIDNETLTIYVLKKGCPYTENMSYILYVNRKNPQTVIASEPVA